MRERVEPALRLLVPDELSVDDLLPGRRRCEAPAGDRSGHQRKVGAAVDRHAVAVHGLDEVLGPDRAAGVRGVHPGAGTEAGLIQPRKDVWGRPTRGRRGQGERGLARERAAGARCGVALVRRADHRGALVRGGYRGVGGLRDVALGGDRGMGGRRSRREGAEHDEGREYEMDSGAHHALGGCCRDRASRASKPPTPPRRPRQSPSKRLSPFPPAPG